MLIGCVIFAVRLALKRRRAAKAAEDGTWLDSLGARASSVSGPSAQGSFRENQSSFREKQTPQGKLAKAGSLKAGSFKTGEEHKAEAFDAASPDRRLSRQASLKAPTIPLSALKLEDAPFAEGGGGQIFRGKYMGSVIAAKRVFNGHMTEGLADFDREVAMLASLSHPSVLALYGISQNDRGDLFMVMEFCGGGDLDGYYKTPAFDKAEYCRVVLELLSGVAYLHNQGVAHRDLKPQNVLLQSGSRKVKIADFGLAKSNASNLTRGVGTAAYMPPEMFSDGDDTCSSANGQKVDVYALGVILWQLWFKKVPFAGKSALAIINKVGKGKRPSLAGAELNEPPSAAPPLPEPLSALVQRCWAEEPDERPGVEAIVADFDAECAPAVAALPGDINQAAAPVAVLELEEVAQLPGLGFGIGGLFGSGDPSAVLEADASLIKAAAGQAPPAPSPKLLVGGQVTVTKAFLASAGLAKYYDALAKNGFTDMDAIADRDVCDDAMLARLVGMSKVDIKKLRDAIASQGASPSMMRQHLALRIADAKARGERKEGTTSSDSSRSGSGEAPRPDYDGHGTTI